MPQTALVGDFEIGAQPLWPMAGVDVTGFFDRPPWERPTPDNPFIPPESDDSDNFVGSPGFNGSGISTGSTGFEGGVGQAGGGMQWEDTGIDVGGGGGDGGGTVVVVAPDGTITTIVIESSRQFFYRLQVYDADGDLVGTVPDWIRGKLKLTMDKASELEFSIPANSAMAASVARPNVVWLRDRWGFVVDTFQIQRRKPRGTGDASYFDFYCLSAISQLGEESILEYDGGDITVLEHVEALLALQEMSNPLTLGTIDADIGDIALPLYAVDSNIHAALLSLQLSLPKAQRGRIYVDPQRRLQWRLEVGDQREQIITRDRNVRSIEAETDYSRIINRLYMYGEGNDPGTRLNLQDAGEAELYVEDTDSQTTYGLQKFIKVDRRFRDPESLLRAANRILEEFAEPPTTVTVELLDIAKADDAPAGWQDIYIGGTYRVQDTTLGIDSSIEIVGIETDLARPVPIRVDLTNQTRDLSDLVTALVEAMQQPLYVDGDRYPTMGRNYSSGVTADNLRAGDTRWNDGESQAEMYDGDSWEPMGGGEEYHYTASTKAGLDDASTVPVAAVGRVDGGGSDNGMFCVPNPAKDGWDALNFFE